MPLLYRGAPLNFPDSDKVKLWREADGRFPFFPGSNKNTHKMREAPTQIGLHWTGAENAPSRVRQTLINRDLSIHFIIDKDGTIWQMADLETLCAHIGRPANWHSFGVEIVSRGFARKADLQGSDLRDRTELDWTEPRDVYTDWIEERRARMVSFYPEQVQSAIWLCETLSGLFSIPRLVPYQVITGAEEAPVTYPELLILHGDQFVYPLFDRDTRKTRRGRRAAWKGTLGHLHVHKDKWDPGTQLFYKLWAEGFNPAGVKVPNWGVNANA